jgi:hypothetical protein
MGTVLYSTRQQTPEFEMETSNIAGQKNFKIQSTAGKVMLIVFSKGTQKLMSCWPSVLKRRETMCKNNALVSFALQLY